MDARFKTLAALFVAVMAMGAKYRTPNFVVEASSQQIAKQVGDSAEQYRKELANLWLGEEMRPWSQPCPISVQTAPHLGAGGATSFYFDRGQVFGWRMTIQGSLERVLDSVLPHEVTHTVFATYFRRPLPRWADEGACTTVEHPSERNKQQRMLIQFLQTGRGIAFSQMFRMKEYPRDVMPLYSQGHSLATYFISQGGRRKFLDYLAFGLQDENWVAATRKYYGFTSLAALQNSWLDWVRDGSRPIQSKPAEDAPILASANTEPAKQRQPKPNLIYRGQSDDSPPAPLGGQLVPVHSATPRAPITANASLDSPSAATEMSSGWHTPRSRKSASSGAFRQPAVESLAGNAAPTAAAAPVRNEMTRPQPAESPRQIILEWSRPPEQASASSGAVNTSGKVIRR